MKRTLLTILTVLVFLTLPLPAHAHVLKTDGAIGAVLHVSPEDDPVVGDPTEFFFEFKDTSTTFAPQNCNCIVTIYKSGEPVYTQPLFQDVPNPSLDDASFSYVLPEKNIYTVEVKGEPITKGSFAPFTLSWDFRVEREGAAPTAKPAQNSVSQYGSFFVGLLFIIVLSVLLKYRKRGGEKK